MFHSWKNKEHAVCFISYFSSPFRGILPCFLRQLKLGDNCCVKHSETFYIILGNTNKLDWIILNPFPAMQDQSEYNEVDYHWSSKGQTMQTADLPFRASWGGEVEMTTKQMFRCNLLQWFLQGIIQGGLISQLVPPQGLLQVPELPQQQQRIRSIFLQGEHHYFWSYLQVHSLRHCSEVVTTAEGQKWCSLSLSPLFNSVTKTSTEV